MKKKDYINAWGLSVLYLVILVLLSSICCAYVFEVGFTSKFKTDRTTCTGGNNQVNVGVAELSVKKGYSCEQAASSFEEISCTNPGDQIKTIPPGGETVVKCSLDSSPFEEGASNCVEVEWCGQKAYENHDKTRVNNAGQCREGECNCQAGTPSEMTCCSGGKMIPSGSRAFCSVCAGNELCAGLETKSSDPEGTPSCEGAKGCGASSIPLIGGLLNGGEDCPGDYECKDGGCVFNPTCCSGSCGEAKCGAKGYSCAGSEKCVPDSENGECVCREEGCDSSDKPCSNKDACGPVICGEDVECRAGTQCRERLFFSASVQGCDCEVSDKCAVPGEDFDYNMCLPQYTPVEAGPDTMDLSGNCYSYACDIVSPYMRTIPGYAGQGITISEMSCPELITKAQSDGLEYMGLEDKPCKGCSHKAALFIDGDEPDLDFHWFRQDSDGKWSQKAGLTFPTNLDYSGNLISDPRTANKVEPDVPDLAYNTFCGYFCVDKSKVGIDGPCLYVPSDEGMVMACEEN